MVSKELLDLIHANNKKYKDLISNVIATKLGCSSLYTEANLWLEPHFDVWGKVEFTATRFTISLDGKDHTIIKYNLSREINNARQKPLKKYDISGHIRDLRGDIDTVEILLKLILESQEEIYKLNEERINADILEQTK